MTDFKPRWTKKTLQIVYIVSAIAVVLLFLVLEILGFASLSTRLVLGSTLFAALVCFYLIESGRHDQSVFLLGSVTWLSVTVVLIFRGGLEVPAVIFYPLVILHFGIFLRPKWAYIAGGFSIAGMFAVLILQLMGIILSPGTVSPLHQFTFYTISLSIISTIVYFASTEIVNSTSALLESQKREEQRRKDLEVQTAELRRTNEALQLSEDRFRLVINNAGDQIVLLDENGTIIDANQHALIELGYSAAELVGTPIFTTGVLWDFERFKEVFEQLPFEESRTHTTQQQRRDGSIFPVEIQARKTKMGDKTVIIGLFRNITERLIAEEKLRDSQKLQSLGLLAGGVAHDFNNLLVAMIGQTSTARQKLADDHPAVKHIGRATRAAKQAAVITKQLLAYSGRGQFEAIGLNINNLIEENLALFRMGIPQAVALNSHLSENTSTIMGDPGQIQQVIMNLIINAAEAIGDKPGTISIYTDTQTIAAEDDYYQKLTLTPLAPGQYLSLEITDDGPGIDPEALQNIFEPFFSTKTTGHGLGLAAVLGIIRGHQGGLNVYSEKNKGTTFKLLFPAVETAPSPPPFKTGPLVKPFFTATVLIIDDDQSVRETMRDILELNGHNVIEAPGGAIALEILNDHADQIDVIILDLTMPGMSGEETLAHIRQITPDHRVILSSGYNHIEAAHRISDRSYSSFLQKPYTVDQLLQVVEKTLHPTP